jgi:acyl-coenzyme A synthetase/AMP-(fatty) acid ligase/acyl carrier protein
MITQRGMLNHLFAKVVDLNLTGKDVIAQTASQCFDISVWQFLAALLVGGQTQIVSDEVVLDPSLLLKDIDDRCISIVETVPSLLRIILEEIKRGDISHPALGTLRWMIPTGEALPPELCRQWLDAYPHIPLLNAYGPTECSDDVAHHSIYHAPSDELVNIPIGRPVANMRLYVLDHLLRPVPLGVAGELCVGGVGVGRGYWNDPERTAIAFVPDPFAQEGGARLYRTGDQARYLTDGTIEFLGRIDQQVKMRGFRIELGEIETVIGRVTGVHKVVVVVREEERGNKRLTAYVVPRQHHSIAFDELRRQLKAELPEYMIPSDFVTLDDIPLTANGKIDRQALPSPQAARVEMKASYEAPRNATEAELAEIWAEVLGVEQVGIHDDFFEIGGHSLLATRVVSRILQRLNVEVPVRAIFESSTLAALAAVVEQKQIDQLGADDLTRIFAALDQLSEGEVEALLDGSRDKIVDDATARE